MKIFGGYEGSRAGHVLDDQRRISRNVFTHVPRHCPGINIEAAAGAAADDDADGFAFVKIIGENRAGNQEKHRGQRLPELKLHKITLQVRLHIEKVPSLSMSFSLLSEVAS